MIAVFPHEVHPRKETGIFPNEKTPARTSYDSKTLSWTASGDIVTVPAAHSSLLPAETVMQGVPLIQQPEPISSHFFWASGFPAAVCLRVRAETGSDSIPDRCF